VMLCHTDVEGGCQHHGLAVFLGGFFGSGGDDLRAHPVRAQQTHRAVLLIRAYGDDDGFGRVQKSRDFGPGGVGETHWDTFKSGLADAADSSAVGLVRTTRFADIILPQILKNAKFFYLAHFRPVGDGI